MRESNGKKIMTNCHDITGLYEVLSLWSAQTLKRIGRKQNPVKLRTKVWTLSLNGSNKALFVWKKQNISKAT